MFSDNLKKARELKGLTQTELAKELLVSNGTVKMWEKGKRYPSLYILKCISVLLECSIDWLLQDSLYERGENDLSINLYNSEHYVCPTEYEALTNIEREEKYVYRPIVYICSPYAGDVDANVMDARRYSRFAVNCGCLPITPHLFFPQFMDDDNPSDRKLAFKLNYILLNKCSQIWVFGDEISDGMNTEIQNAKRKNIQIRYFNEKCEEVFKR